MKQLNDIQACRMLVSAVLLRSVSDIMEARRRKNSTSRFHNVARRNQLNLAAHDAGLFLESRHATFYCDLAGFSKTLPKHLKRAAETQTNRSNSLYRACHTLLDE